MSRSYANQLAWDLEFDYTPSAVIFRGAYAKGLLVTVDFQEYAEKYGVKQIVDIWGNYHDVSDIQVILSQSQFKLAGAYDSIEQYLSECKKRDFNWSIVRVAPQHDEKFTRLTYQYLQILDLSDEQIDVLCKDTVEYFVGVSGMDWVSSILFLNGRMKDDTISPEWFHSLDPLVKVLFYNNPAIS